MQGQAVRDRNWGGWIGRAMVMLLFALPNATTAQQLPLAGIPVLSLDQEQFFIRSSFGRAALAANKAATEALVAEFQKIEAALADEERALTAQRASLPVAEFSIAAQLFDQKVESIRQAQKARPQELQRALDAEKVRFYEAARPVLTSLMAERGAYAIIDKRVVVLGFDAIDLTPIAIERIDAVLGDDSEKRPLPAPAP